MIDLSIHGHGTYLAIRVMYIFVSLVRLHWGKKGGSVFRSNQSEIVSGLGIGMCTHFFFQPCDPIGLRLVEDLRIHVLCFTILIIWQVIAEPKAIHFLML